MLTNFILCALCFMLLLYHLYSILSNLKKSKVRRKWVRRKWVRSPKEKSPEEPISYTTEKAQTAPFLLTNFILCALFFMLLLYHISTLYSLISNFKKSKVRRKWVRRKWVRSPQENSPEELISYTNKKGAVCAFFVNQLYSLCFML